jgi:pilus assembly protein CpaE
MSALTRPRSFADDGQPAAVAYTRDPDSEGVLRQALRDLSHESVIFRSGGLRSAVTELAGHDSPNLLVVDISGESDPVDRVRELIDTCEPATRVLVLGDHNDIRLYRGLLDAGASEYLFKPLVSAVAARVCRKLLFGDASIGANRLGRLVYVVGARGGSGASTVAVALASTLSESPPRPVVLIDLDLQCGDVALSLNAEPNSALRAALTQADRVDDLLLERGLIQITGRLDMLGSLDPLDSAAALDEDALIALLDRVTRRYRYVVVEIPAHAAARLKRVLHMPSTLVLVSDARLSSARDVARWRATIGESTAERGLVHVLNRAGAAGGLPLADFTRAAGQAPDFVIPYAREIAEQALLGRQGVLAKGVQPLAALLGGESVAARRPIPFLKRLLG